MSGRAAYPIATIPGVPAATSNIPTCTPLSASHAPASVASDAGDRVQVRPSAVVQTTASQETEFSALTHPRPTATKPEPPAVTALMTSFWRSAVTGTVASAHDVPNDPTVPEAPGPALAGGSDGPDEVSGIHRGCVTAPSPSPSICQPPSTDAMPTCASAPSPELKAIHQPSAERSSALADPSARIARPVVRRTGSLDPASRRYRSPSRTNTMRPSGNHAGAVSSEPAAASYRTWIASVPRSTTRREARCPSTSA